MKFVLFVLFLLVDFEELYFSFNCFELFIKCCLERMLVLFIYVYYFMNFLVWGFDIFFNNLIFMVLF